MEKKDFLQKLGRNIVRLREEKGLSQTDLAKKCEKERQSLERLENGKINASAYYLSQIAAALEMPLKDLLDFE
jgi:putative transcriptional regulator